MTGLPNADFMYVVDIGDDCVIFEGTPAGCVEVLEVMAGNLCIAEYEFLTAGMLQSLEELRQHAQS